MQNEGGAHAGPQAVVVFVIINACGGITPRGQAAAAGEANQAVMTKVAYSLQ